MTLGVDVAPEVVDETFENRDEAIVEYPDGAPPELVREMKEPDPDAGTEVRSRASKRKSEVPVKDKPLTLRRQGPLGSTPVVAPKGGEGSFGKTPGCPACSSGMVAPGIRHSAACRRRLHAGV